MKESVIEITGDVVVKVKSPNGSVVERRIKNLVVNGGTAHIATLLSGNTAALMQFIAIGGSNIAPAAGDVALVNELYRKSASITLAPDGNTNQVKYETTWIIGTAAGTLREAGIFNAAAGPTMLSRVTFADTVVGAADTLVVSWVISFTGV